MDELFHTLNMLRGSRWGSIDLPTAFTGKGIGVRTGHYWGDFASLIHISTNFLLEWKCDELHMMKINSSNARHDSSKEAKGDSILVIMGLSLLNTICLANTMSNASIYTQEEDKQF
jgi:hypothetical protein